MEYDLMEGNGRQPALSPELLGEFFAVRQ